MTTTAGRTPTAVIPTAKTPFRSTFLIGVTRETLGRAYYDRMRNAMTELPVPPWTHLTEGQREAYRARLDFVLPYVLALLDRVSTGEAS